MHKGRLEAFSDAVIAIIITIMVLELKVPHGAEPSALRPLIPVFLSYVLSFVTLGIYWNNHHHMLQVCDRISGPVLWANLHLLFWLSLMPFTTAWMGENHFALWPVVCFGGVLLASAISYYILVLALLRCHAPDSRLARAVGRDFKGKASMAIYAAAIALAFLSPWIGLALYWLVAFWWLIPDPRMEQVAA
jgi:uncharacterized membrane protein